MANTTPAAARVGYDIFRRSGFSASMDVINEELGVLGYPPISERTYRHYRGLAAAGFNRYISINRFDVARASEPYENLSSNGLYRYVDAHVPVRVTFPRGRRLVEALGRANRIGETGLILNFDDPKTVVALTEKPGRPHVGESLRVELLDPPGQYDARVIEVETSAKMVTMEVEFERLQSIGVFVGKEPLDLSRFRLRLVSEIEGNATVDVVGRQLHGLFEVVEAARSVVNEMAQISSDGKYAPVAPVHQLSMKSPLSAIVGLPDPVGLVLSLGFGLLSTALMYENWRRKRLENNSVEIDNEVKAAKAEFEKQAAGLRGKIIKQLSDSLGVDEKDAPDNLVSIDRFVETVQSLAEQDVQAGHIKKSQSKGS